MENLKTAEEMQDIVVPIEETKKEKKEPILQFNGQKKINVLTLDGYVKNKKMAAPPTTGRENFVEFYNKAKQTEQMLSAKVIGVKRVAQDNGAQFITDSIDGGYTLVVFGKNFTDVKENKGKRSQAEYERYVLAKRMGSHFDYIIKDVDHKNKIVVGDRLEAMKIKEDSYYRSVDGEAPLITEGTHVECRVVVSNRTNLIVEAFGIECFVPIGEIDYRSISDVTKLYSAGDIVNAKVLAINEDDKGEISLSLSIKQTQENPFIKKIEGMNSGDKWMGKVTKVDTFGIFVALDNGVTVLCRPPIHGEIVTKGNTVTVSITVINMEYETGPRVFGYINHIAKNK